ncbi:Uncharacterised protein [Mycobacteroides abscessus subsp. abscessus]|nr:Uncharacterised protein [Mycobacteroides abscessus subsp. abscessus]
MLGSGSAQCENLRVCGRIAKALTRIGGTGQFGSVGGVDHRANRHVFRTGLPGSYQRGPNQRLIVGKCHRSSLSSTAPNSSAKPIRAAIMPSCSSG